MRDSRIFRRLGTKVRSAGLAGNGARLVAYASAAAHCCVAQAMDLCGLGHDALSSIALESRGQIDSDALRATSTP